MSFAPNSPRATLRPGLPEDPSGGRAEHRRVRRRSLLAMLGLILVFSTAVLAGMEFGLRRELSRALGTDLTRTAAAFSEHLNSSSARLLSEARVVAEEPRIKAALNTPDIDRATLEDIAEEMRKAVRWDILVLTDAGGELLAATGTRTSKIAASDVIRGATRGTQSSGYAADSGRLYQLAAVPIVFGPQRVGLLVAGYELDEPWAIRFTRSTDTGVALFAGPDIVATSLPATRVHRRDAQVWIEEGAPWVANLAGERFLARLVTMDAPTVRAGLFRSEDLALRPYHRLRNIVLGVSALLALLAVVAAFFVSRELSNPVAQIESHAQAVREAYQKLKEMDELIAEDLEQAREFQKRILPSPPAVDGLSFELLYQPVSEVGGDIYDIHRLEDGRVRIFLADATGHGVPAALTTMWVRSEYDVVKDDAPSPAAALSKLNERIEKAHEQTGAWFTAICLDVDPRTGRVVYATAGHPGPCLVHGGDARSLDSGGPFIGLSSLSSFDDYDLTLKPGDRMYAYTDGATEEWDRGGRDFGETGLNAVLREPPPVLDRLAATLMDFVSPQQGLQDDVTVIGIGWTGTDFKA